MHRASEIENLGAKCEGFGEQFLFVSYPYCSYRLSIPTVQFLLHPLISYKRRDDSGIHSFIPYTSSPPDIETPTPLILHIPYLLEQQVDEQAKDQMFSSTSVLPIYRVQRLG